MLCSLATTNCGGQQFYKDLPGQYGHLIHSVAAAAVVKVERVINLVFRGDLIWRACHNVTIGAKGHNIQ